MGDGEEVTIEEEQDTEVDPLRLARDPGQPTLKQIEEHRRAHLPYRLWCKWCVLGRGRGLQHRRSPGSSIPVVGVDYFFMNKKGVHRREELEFEQTAEGNSKLEEARAKGEIVKCIAVRCTSTKALFGHVVPCKGADEEGYVADTVVQDVAWLGHTKVIVKADGEPALQALIKRVLEVARVECPELQNLSKEDPPTYDSQANGGIETGVRLIRGLFRTVKMCTEARINKFIPVDHPITAWMLEHVCLLLNTMVRGTDGLTAWGRVKGRSFGQQLLGFGECVLYRYPTKGPRHAPDGNMGALGGEAIFLGYNTSSSTFRLYTSNGPVDARSVTRRPQSERWNAEELAKVKTLPGAAREQRARPRLDQPAPVQGPTVDQVRPTQLRQLRINITDLRKYDHYNGNCQQCRYIERYGRAKPGGNHTDACRKGLLDKTGQTEEGRARIQAHEDRTNQIMAERIEEHAAAHEGHQAQVPQPCDDHDRPRPFLDRADDGGEAHPQPAGREAPRDDGAEAAAPSAAASAAERVQRAPPRSALVRPPVEVEEPAWQDVPGGAEAPTTPRGTPPVSEPVVGAEAQEETDDAEMDADPEADGPDVEMEFVGNLEVEDSLGSLEPSAEDFAAGLLLQQLGALGRRYKREARRGARALVSEVYSPPRVTKLIREVCAKYVAPGLALDLTVNDPWDNMPWDFSITAKRRRARQLFAEQKPYILIGSPECTQFCTFQALNLARSKDPEAMQRAKTAALVHLQFVAQLYEDQMAGGRYFLHEHPLRATSWSEDPINDLLRRPAVIRVHGDQCQYGAEVQSGPHKGQPLLKPTGFMTNAPAVARALSLKCQGTFEECSRKKGGQHHTCAGKHAREAARYPRELCRAMLKGVRDQLREDNLLKTGCFGIQVPDEDAEVEKNLRGPAQGYSGRFVDDLTGQVLRDDLVKEARAKELAFFHSKGVWLKVPKTTARAVSGKNPISVRWVDVNKGDELHPKYRSRLVARQMKAHDLSGQSYFAPAPPLEALRTVISLAMTEVGKHKPDWNPRSPTRTQISMVDVTRAYFNAKIDADEPATFVQLPAEEPDAESMCARLIRHMYGTRSAADGWQEEYSTFLVSLGFKQGNACPNTFYHEQRQIATSVHGDDFTSSGPANALDWLEESIAENYEITVAPRMGPGEGDAKEGRVLNRIIRWCGDRVEYEADPRQVERLVAECGLEGANAVATPGVKATFKQLEEDAELPAHLNTAFRGAAARDNYLAPDRIDVQFACKEVCRSMSRPTRHAWEALKRICRYLNRAPRLVYEFKQQSVSHVDVYTDTDWAGCPRTRKSTSGGCVMFGQHAVKHWSSTQASVSLSSGEAEFAGVIRGAGQGLGYQALLSDLGVEVPLRVWTDSSAAIGICTRQGLGKLRHLDTHTLWVQQAVRTKRIDLRKVDGEQNPADLLTKHSIGRQRLDGLVSLYGCKHLEGRAESAPQVRKGVTARVTMAEADRVIGATGSPNELVAQPAARVEVAGQMEETSPIMPHLLHSAMRLDELYPAIEAPPDEPLQDIQQDARDAVYQHGLRIAEHIRQQTEVEGRRRRPGAGGDAGETSRTGGGIGGEPQLGAVMWQMEERAVNSTFSSRRSEKASHQHHYQCHHPDLPALDLPIFDAQLFDSKHFVDDLETFINRMSPIVSAQ